jgi:hypothetical protein
MDKRAAAAIGVLAICGIGVLAVPATAAGIKAGKWEFTTTMQGIPMPKLPPGVQLPPNVHMGGNTTTFTTCITGEHAVPQNPSGPGGPGGRGDCTVGNTSVSGGTVSWSEVCRTGRGEMHGTGKATYSGDAMQSTTTIDMVENGEQAMHMTQTTTGRYLGPCN